MTNDNVEFKTSEAAKREKEDKKIEELAIMAIGGDTDALCQLCEAIAKNVLFRTKYILKNETDAEDVAQEVLIRVCENIRSLRLPKAFKAWLGGIIVNEANRHIAKAMKEGVTSDIQDYIESFEDDREHIKPQRYVESVEVSVALMELLRNLPLRQREAVMLHYYDELSVVEVAEAMGITKQNASKYIGLAREKMKKHIESAPHSSKLGAMAAVPIGVLMADAMCAEAAIFVPANAAWVGGALAQCQIATLSTAGGTAQYIAAEGAKELLKEGGKSAIKIVAGSVAAACVAGAVLLGVVVGGTPNETSAAAIEQHIEGTILFSGDSAAEHSHVNPRHATPQIENAFGEVTIIYWWIEEITGGSVLYSGDNHHSADDVLNDMIAKGDYGEYKIFFRTQDEIGSIFVLGSNFFVEPTAEAVDI